MFFIIYYHFFFISLSLSLSLIPLYHSSFCLGGMATAGQTSMQDYAWGSPLQLADSEVLYLKKVVVGAEDSVFVPRSDFCEYKNKIALDRRK